MEPITLWADRLEQVLPRFGDRVVSAEVTVDPDGRGGLEINTSTLCVKVSVARFKGTGSLVFVVETNVRSHHHRRHALTWQKALDMLS